MFDVFFSLQISQFKNCAKNPHNTAILFSDKKKLTSITNNFSPFAPPKKNKAEMHEIRKDTTQNVTRYEIQLNTFFLCIIL